MSSEFLNRSDTKRAVQPQKMARGFDFRSMDEEELYYLCSAATMQLSNAFAYAKGRLSHDTAHIIFMFCNFGI